MAFEESTGLLMSSKFFSAHICVEAFAEANRSSTDEDGDDDSPAPDPDASNTVVESRRVVRRSADEDVV